MGRSTENFILKIKVKSDSNEYFILKDVQLGENLSIIEARIYTQAEDQQDGTTFKGVMGLGARPTETLFYQDGTYRFWNRKKKSDGEGPSSGEEDS